MLKNILQFNYKMMFTIKNKKNQWLYVFYAYLSFSF